MMAFFEMTVFAGTTFLLKATHFGFASKESNYRQKREAHAAIWSKSL